MISLKTLVTVAPFDEETRNLVLGKIEKNELSDNQKVQMSEVCWNMITKLYEAELQLKFDSMITEVANKQKVYSQNDYMEERAKLVYRFASELNAANTKEELEEVQKQLATHTTKSK